MRAGKLIERRGGMTPCAVCPKIPKDAIPKPENAIEMSAKNRRAYFYSIECAVDNLGILPQDEVTVRNNALVKRILDAHERSRTDVAPLMMALMAGLGGNKK